MKLFRLILLLALCTVPAHAQSIFDYRIWGVNTGTAVKAPVVAATTAAITLSGAQTIDGISVTDHLNDTTGLPPDRVLVKNQADQTTNGIYNVNSSGAWTEASDFTGANNLVNGTIIIVARGNANAGLWQLTTSNPVIVAPDTSGASNITFAAYTATSASAILGSVCTTAGGVFDFTGSAYGCLAPPASTPAFLMGNIGSVPSYVTNLSSLPGTGGTLTLPSGPDTVTGNATTATLTNKTYDTGASGNVFKINGSQISSISGNTTKVATASGTLTNTHCVSIDGSGNFVDAGGACTTGGGGGTVSSATQYQIAYYTGTGTTVGGQSSLATDAHGVLTIGAGTITTNDPALNVTETWNASGTTFSGIFENITNTASSSGSLLENLQVGGSTKWSIDKNGNVTNGTWQGSTIGLGYGGLGTSLASTGGASEVLKQTSSGANISVGQLACSDLSNAATSCSTDATNASNLSGGTVPTARLGSGSASSSTYLRGDQSWATVSSGSMVLLATVNASASTSVVFGSTYITSTYNKYVLEFDGLYPNTNNQEIYLVMSTNNGSSYISSYSISGFYTVAPNSGGTTVSGFGGNGGPSVIDLFGGQALQNTTNYAASGTIKLSNLATTSLASIVYDTTGPNGSDNMLRASGGGGLASPASINAIKIYASSGNISGNFHLYGIQGN